MIPAPYKKLCSQFYNETSAERKLNMKKRYIKRLVKKVLFFLFTIIWVSVITSFFIKYHLKDLEAEKQTVKLPALDGNGDPVTQPYSRADNLPPRQRHARPPVQLRDLPVREPPHLQAEQHYEANLERLMATQSIGAHLQLPVPQGAKKDWHDYEAIERDKQRSGLGEQGLFAFNQPHEEESEKALFRENGFNALLSDKISLNRSLPDTRPKACQTRQYLAKLPKTSVIFIFYEEYWSVLMRSIHSIINRTPPELLQEIILVDDGSTRKYLKEPLDIHVAKYWPKLVRIIRNPQRLGLMGARMAGSRAATGEVLVLFDSHIEATHNWLPPLLEPITLNHRISTIPIVDAIDHTTFAYEGTSHGARGGFDWTFDYQTLPDNRTDLSQPYANPVMIGGLFAISRKYFMDELQGYDPMLDIWGAEQYEISFKIWMCGGMILNVPCSRVAHIYRGPMDERPNPRKYNFVARNIKRVVEVWMDDYKKYIYKRQDNNFMKTDPGDMTEQHALRARLKCKSFHWFLTEVAPDFLAAFPVIDPPAYAQGAVQSLAYPNLCIDTCNHEARDQKPLQMFSCADDKVNPQPNQFISLRWKRDLTIQNLHTCIDAQDSAVNGSVTLYGCHGQGGNQFWYYDRKEQWLVHGKSGSKCMEAFYDGKDSIIHTNTCDVQNPRMRWKFGFVNDTYMDKFFDDILR